MNVLLLGSGGREHAIAWKLAQSPRLTNLFIAPGNGGTSRSGKNVDLNISDFDSIQTFCADNEVVMIVVGPEQPLVDGIYDYFEDSSIQVVGPSKKGAMLEGSKSFSKKIMEKYGVPTAAYGEYTTSNIDKGIAHIENSEGPYVLKADGLAAGKGVLIIEDANEAKEALQEMIMDSKFGHASETVVIEEFLDGIEFSVFVLTDGDHYKILPHAKDYKRIGEGDEGLNTGGMGAISPVPFVDDALIREVEDTVIQPMMKALRTEQISYQGFLYCGLIKTDKGIKVIEFNCRMGDPETQVVMPRLNSDLLELFISLDKKELKEQNIEISNEHAMTVVIASNGYPQSYPKGVELSLPEESGTFIFHAGTKIKDNRLVNTGGRVLTVTSLGDSLKACRDKALAVCNEIKFDEKYYRKDIGYEFIS